MPFLRFSRDQRGYESTYLCHTFRRGGKQEFRVLYWFRTPPNVKVGRLALDPVAIRAIEESNPDLRFDWGKILEVKPPPPPPDYGRAGPDRRRRGPNTSAASAPSVSESGSAPLPNAPPEPVAVVDTRAEPSAADGAPVAALDAPAPAIAAWDEPDQAEADPQTGAWSTHVVLGLTDEEGLARLRASHAEIQARIQRSGSRSGEAGESARTGRAARPGWVAHGGGKRASAWRRSVRRRALYARCSDAGRRTRRGGAGRRPRRSEGTGDETGTTGDRERPGASVDGAPAEPAAPSDREETTRNE